MMGRQSGAILILSALVAFFLPLVGRVLWQQYQQFMPQPALRSPVPAQARSALPQRLAHRVATSDASRVAPARHFEDPNEPGRVAVASYERQPPNIFSGYDARGLRGELPGGMGIPADGSEAVEGSPSWSQPPDPLLAFKSTLVKLGFVSVALVLVCLVCFRFGQPLGFARQAARQLHVEDSIALSREAGVKLICVGDQKFVVGHDRRGVQSLVMLPQRFEEVFRGELRDGTAAARAAANVAESIRTTLTNPEDDGWELNRRIS